MAQRNIHLHQASDAALWHEVIVSTAYHISASLVLYHFCCALNLKLFYFLMVLTISSPAPLCIPWLPLNSTFKYQDSQTLAFLLWNNILKIFFLGWGDGPVNKVFLLKAWGPEFYLQNSHWKCWVWCWVLIIPKLQRWRWVDPCDSRVSQSRFLNMFQISERLCLAVRKERKEGKWKEERKREGARWGGSTAVMKHYKQKECWGGKGVFS